MKILAIETSCDETAISILNFKSKYKFEILSEIVLSQIEIHKEYGGVFPALAKREHLKNLFPIFLESLKKANLLEKSKKNNKITQKKLKKIKKIMDRDPENLEKILNFYKKHKKAKIDAIAVTYGPGLEIALWTGFNFAKTLAEIWDLELIPTNHLEGHLYSALIKKEEKRKYKLEKTNYPSLGVLISGGHTELILIKNHFNYQLLGQTLDDAIGEAFDKTARLIGINYPGGPILSKLAQNFEKKFKNKIKNLKKHEIKEWFSKKFNFYLPRPMINAQNNDFSFSGLKTAVLYLTKKQKKIDQNFKEALAWEFENSVSEVLLKKIEKILKKYPIKEILVGGGVSANQRIRKELKIFTKKEKIKIYFPDKKYTGDNATMIGVAGYYKYIHKRYKKEKKVYSNLEIKYICK